MGTDLFTSGRGAGVIGTIMAIVVLVGFGTLYILVFDKSLQGGERMIESVIAENKRSIDALNARVEDVRTRSDEANTNRKIVLKLDEEKLQDKLVGERIAALEQSAAKALSEIESIESDWVEYRQSYRNAERNSAKGETMDKLTTSTGKTFLDVKITDVDAVRVQIRHSRGIKGIPFEELPEALQDRFQFATEEKKNRIAAEIAQRKRGLLGSSIQSLENQVDILKRQNQEAKVNIKRLEKALSNASAAQPVLSTQLESKKSELLRDKHNLSSSSSSGRTGISRAPQIREEISHIESKLRLANKRIPFLTQEISGERMQITEREQKILELLNEAETLTQKLKGDTEDQ